MSLEDVPLEEYEKLIAKSKFEFNDRLTPGLIDRNNTNYRDATCECNKVCLPDTHESRKSLNLMEFMHLIGRISMMQEYADKDMMTL